MKIFFSMYYEENNSNFSSLSKSLEDFTLPNYPTHYLVLKSLSITVS